MRIGLLLGLLLLLAGRGVSAAPAPASPSAAARTFVESLTPAQRAQVVQPLDSADRGNWHYVPRTRRGLALGRMTAAQQAMARSLLTVILGVSGAAKAEQVLGLEGVLQRSLPAGTRRRDPTWRSPGLYHVALFGRPDAEGTWALRVEGHHLSVNAVVSRDRVISTTPLFFGASPSQAPGAGGTTLRPLGLEEDLARALVLGTREIARREVLVSSRAPGDIRLGPFSPATATGRGATLAFLSAESQARFWRLVEAFTAGANPRLAGATLATLRRTDPRQIRFAWEGSLRPGLPHAYTIETPTAIFEYVNRGNHVHTVWRTPGGDFGR